MFNENQTCTLCSDIPGYSEPWSQDEFVPGGSRCSEVCGDGLNYGSEQCDDGNT